MLIPDIISSIKAKIVCCCSKCGNRGALLLDIAIALSIIGLISGFAATKIMTIRRSMSIQETRNNIEYVKTALAAYLANHNRLPRPSHDASGNETSAVSQDLSSFVGFVPFKTIGIPERYAKDGRNFPLVYVVEPALTGNFDSIYEHTMTDTAFCHGVLDSSIIIKGQPVLMPDVVACVIDTRRPNIMGKILVDPTNTTAWITRDILLMQYLKNSPCKQTRNRQDTDIANNDFFL